jgi:hypothetical protein
MMAASLFSSCNAEIEQRNSENGFAPAERAFVFGSGEEFLLKIETQVRILHPDVATYRRGQRPIEW